MAWKARLYSLAKAGFNPVGIVSAQPGLERGAQLKLLFVYFTPVADSGNFQRHRQYKQLDSHLFVCATLDHRPLTFLHPAGRGFNAKDSSREIMRAIKEWGSL